jgi:hypothetical protein
MTELGWLSFCVVLAAVILTAIPGYRARISSRDYFHVPGERRNVVSLGIADITLGTGVVYLLAASTQNGAVTLAIPLGVVIGYWLLAKFYREGIPDAVLAHGNLAIGIREELCRKNAIGNRWVFDALVLAPLVVVFVLVMAYEVFASSQIIGAFISPGNSSAPSIIGFGILAASAINTFGGGMQASYRNDSLLAVLIVSFFVLLVAVSWRPLQPELLANLGPESKFLYGNAGAAAAIVAVSIGFINAILTQHYSLLNAYTATNFQERKALSRTFRRVGVVIGGMLTVLVIVGTLWPTDPATPFPVAIAQRLQGATSDSLLEPLLVVLVVAGMTAITFSTTDTLLLALAYFLVRNAFNTRESDRADPSGAGVSTRIVSVLLIVLIMPPLGYFYSTDLNLFFLLLTIAGGGAVFAPFLVGAAMAAAPGRSLTAFGASAHVAVFGLYLVNGVLGVWMLIDEPTYLPFLGLATASASAFLSIWLYRRSGARSADLDKRA